MSAERWVLREIMRCDVCDGRVECLYDGEEHWQDGAVALGECGKGQQVFCRLCADSPRVPAQEDKP